MMDARKIRKIHDAVDWWVKRFDTIMWWVIVGAVAALLLLIGVIMFIDLD